MFLFTGNKSMQTFLLLVYTNVLELPFEIQLLRRGSHNWLTPTNYHACSKLKDLDIHRHKSQSFFEFIPLSVKVAKPKAGTCFHTEYVSINYIYQTFPASASFEDKVAAFNCQLGQKYIFFRTKIVFTCTIYFFYQTVGGGTTPLLIFDWKK
jgi:hypothetical protein